MTQYQITPEQAKEFEIKFHAGEFSHQRYGQAFCNHFNIQSSTIFYMENEKDARFTVWYNFVNCERFLGE